MIVTSALRQPNWRATTAINSSLALPSTGGDLRWASQVPASDSANVLARAFGLTLT